jgi:hypothetical protein
MRTRRLVPAAAVAIAYVIAGCDKPSDVKGLAGTYVMAVWGVHDTLQLRVDGRYVRTLAGNDKHATTDSGGWFVASHGKAVALREYPKRIPFVHDLMNDPKGTKLLIPSMVSLTVARSWKGALRLEWYPSFGWSYVRVR